MVLSFSNCKTIEHETLPADTDVPKEMTALEKSMIEAEESQLGVKSPENFAEAKENFNEAKTLQQSNGDRDDLLEKIAISKAHLHKAQLTAQISGETIPEVFKAREDALKAGAGQHYAKEMASIDNDLMDVTEEIEDDQDKSDALSERKELSDRYLSLELKSIKENHIGEARRSLDEAIANDAKSFAPRTLALASNKVALADRFIEANRHNPDVAKVSDDATAEAEHLVIVTKEAKEIGGNDPELVVLEREGLQADIIAERARVSATEAELGGAQEAIDMSKSEIQAAQEENSRLMADKEFNEKLMSAENVLSKDEAEVFREGNALVIRLKTMDFKPGTSTLATTNYDILNRVNNIITELAPAAVLVEGHTDSTGSEKLNQRLSEERASTVKNYLTSTTATESQVKVETIGFGASRPIAPNNTKDGRATNRRVDIRIQPDTAVSH
jgi:outer membrane protein OmpA-like peptidoglycan-associated protein